MSTQVKVPLLFEVLGTSTELPQQLRITPPEYFLLVDSGADVHVLWDQCLGSDSGSSILEQEEPIAPLYVDRDAQQDQSSDDDLVQ